MQKQKSKAGLLLMITMFMTLVTVPNVNAQSECLGLCEENYELCLRENGSNCIAKYQLCAIACISSANAVLE